MSSKLLVTKSPYLTTYCYYGSVLSMINGLEGYKDWLFSNFISLRLNNRGVLTYDITASPTYHTPWTKANTISREMVEYKWDSIIEFIVDSINMDNYVFVKVNRRYLSCSDRYGVKDGDHEILIYGYDLERKIFYISDNLKGGKYVLVECPFNEIIEAYSNVRIDKMGGVMTIKVDENKGFNMKIEEVKDRMLEYVNPTTSIFKYTQIPLNCVLNNFQDAIGIEVYDELVQQLKKYEVKGINIDNRVFHLLGEHKKCMKDRMLYLAEKGYVHISDNDIERLELIEQTFNIIRKLVLKYNLTKSNDNISKIIDKINYIKPIEKELLTEITNRIAV